MRNTAITGIVIDGAEHASLETPTSAGKASASMRANGQHRYRKASVTGFPLSAFSDVPKLLSIRTGASAERACVCATMSPTYRVTRSALATAGTTEFLRLTWAGEAGVGIATGIATTIGTATGIGTTIGTTTEIATMIGIEIVTGIRIETALAAEEPVFTRKPISKANDSAWIKVSV